MHARQSIVTKYLCPTNFKGSRIKATSQAGSKTYSWDDSIGTEDNHHFAAQEYADAMKWGDIHGLGQLPDGTGYVATFAWSK